MKFSSKIGYSSAGIFQKIKTFINNSVSKAQIKFWSLNVILQNFNKQKMCRMQSNKIDKTNFLKKMKSPRTVQKVYSKQEGLDCLVK